MSNTSGIRAGKAYVELFAEQGQLRKGLAEARSALVSWGKNLQAAGAGIAAAGAAGLAPFLTAALSFEQAGSNLDDMSQRTGIAVETLSALGYAAKLSGTDLDTVEKAIKKLHKAGIPLDEQLLAVADELAAIEDQSSRARRATELFGKSGTDVLPFLQQGSEGIRRLTAAAHQAGVVMSTEDAQAAAALGDQFDRLRAASEAVTIQLGAALAPALTEIAEVVIECSRTVIQWAKENRGLALTVAAVSAGLVATGVAIIGTGVLLTALGGIVAGVSALIGGLGTVLAIAFSPVGALIVGLGAAAAATLYFSGAGTRALADLAEAFETLKTDATIALKGVADALATGNIALAGKILWSTLKLEWARGVKAVMEIWHGFERTFTEGAISIGTTIATALIDAFATVKQQLIELAVFAAQQPLRIQRALGQMTEEQYRLSAAGIGIAVRAMTGDPRAEADVAKRLLTAGAAEALEARDARRAKALDENAKAVVDAFNELASQANEAARAREAQRDPLNIEQQRDTMETAYQAARTDGSFSGSATLLGQKYGGINIEERIAKAAENTVAELGKLRRDVANLANGLNFA